MLKKVQTLLVLFVAFIPLAHAGYHGTVHVKSISYNGEYAVHTVIQTVSGASYGGSECTDPTNLYLDERDPEYKTKLSLIQTAALAQLTISFWADGCMTAANEGGSILNSEGQPIYWGPLIRNVIINYQ